MKFKTWVPIILLILNLVATVVTKFNDIKHISEDLKTVIIKVDDLCQRMSRIEGYMAGKK